MLANPDIRFTRTSSELLLGEMELPRQLTVVTLLAQLGHTHIQTKTTCKNKFETNMQDMMPKHKNADAHNLIMSKTLTNTPDPKI